MSLIGRATDSEMKTSFYAYKPSLAVAIVAAVFYTVAFTLTAIQWIRHRAWVWSIMVLAAASTCAFSLSDIFTQSNP
jgi:cation transport ATPase